ncbi:MAG: hypothetical protein WC468_01450 [Candidatus Paceibacterota bacterium]
MEELLLDREKIRTMKKDIKEAEGVLVYPREEDSVDLTQCIARGLGENGTVPESCEPETIEEEKKKAEDLAYELAISTNESEDNIKEKVLQEEPEAPRKDEAIFSAPELDSVSVPEPEPDSEFKFEEIPQMEEAPEPVAEPEPEHEPEEVKTEEKAEEKVPDLEPLPSAKDLGLEDAEPEKIPSAEDLGLEEPKEDKVAEEELKKIDENEEKLAMISEKTFELEEQLRKVNEDKAPFEKRKAEIGEEINNIKKKLDLILERKARVDEMKKDLESREATATPEEKRSIEKERWKVEDDRNLIEKEKDGREDEIKSLRLQMRECEINAEKTLAKEKEVIQELEILKRDKDRIILGQTKIDLEKRLEPLNQEIESIKREMFENTKQKDKLEKSLNDIRMREKGTEDEIKILERRQAETKDETISRDIENRRRTIEESRRQLEKDRWDQEDKMGDLEERRKLIKEKYQEVATQAKQIKAELLEIEEKIK